VFVVCVFRGSRSTGRCKPRATALGLGQATSWSNPCEKLMWNHMSQVGTVSVFTLIRTDTTLDLSQKAEKVWTVPQRDSSHLSFIAPTASIYYGSPQMLLLISKSKGEKVVNELISPCYFILNLWFLTLSPCSRYLS